MQDNFSITNKTKGALQSVPFREIKDLILGKDYKLSLVFIGNAKSKELNKTYRDKDYPTNVLSFPLDKNSGEIFLTPSVAKKESVKFGKNYKNFVGFLFIHGILHLKGMQHGSTMEKAEIKFCKKFNF